MARYDRIARIPPPEREAAFPGWLALRDLEGRERDPEMGRRARLRFLALRPVRRLLQEGMDGPGARSFQDQLDHVREELEQLPAGDPERTQLLDYLRAVERRTPALVTATLDVGATAEAAGHFGAADEFYHTAFELAREHRLPQQQVRALRRLARVRKAQGDWDAAMELGREAGALADMIDDLFQWALATDGMAAVCTARGDRRSARGLLDAITRRGEAADDRRVRAIGTAGTCALQLASGNAESALEAGLSALGLFGERDPHRNRLLLDMAAAFRRLGLWQAAETCYAAVTGRAAWVEHRAEAAAEHAVMAAERGDSTLFRRRRAELLDLLYDADPRLTSLLHLGIGRGCVLVGDDDDAREHLRQAIATARAAVLDTVLVRAEELLHALERGAGVRTSAQADPVSERGRRLARRTQSLLARRVPAS